MPRDEVVAACETGRPVRLHLRDREVVVARILGVDEEEFRFAPITSSRPERYAVCDSTGFIRRFDELERAVMLAEPRKKKARPS